MKVRDVMTPDVVTVSPEMTIQDVALLLTRHKISGVPVLDDGVIVGIVTEGDLLPRQKRVPFTDEELPALFGKYTVGEELRSLFQQAWKAEIRTIMTPGDDVLTADAEEPLEEAAARMSSYEVKRLPVVEDGRLVGVLSRLDILTALVGSGTS